jgi:hypothetical protein
LIARETACVHKITAVDSKDESTPVTFDRDSSNGSLVLNLPFKGKQAGTYSLAIAQHGTSTIARVDLPVYSKDIRVDKMLVGTSGSAIL